MEIYFSTGDAGERLGLSVDRVRQLCNQGKLNSIRLSDGTRAIPAESLEQLAQERAKRVKKVRCRQPRVA